MTEFIQFTKPQINYSEIFRYARCEETKQLRALADECLVEAENVLTYNVCYCKMTKQEALTISGNSTDFAKGIVKGEIVLFCATVGLQFDMLIKRYSATNSVKALMMQAIGAERVESLCDEFCKSIGKPKRFSPGYGDMSLSVQKNIFKVIDCQKIGVYLNDSLLMTPSKSVTAFAFE